MIKEFTETSSKLAREAGITEATVRRYADLKLLDFILASDGTRLFAAGQAGKVREILAKRQTHRRRAPAST